MLNLKQFMVNVNVSKKKYVHEWLDADLIPGVILGDQWEDTQFPESARRPYRTGSLKAGLDADKLRAHIVKACIDRQHISHKQCFMSKGEFEAMVDELVCAVLIRRRMEDGIQYYDSTTHSDEYIKKPLSEVRAFVIDALKAISEGAVKGLIDKIQDAA